MTTNGVVVSADSGNSFNPDTQLTNLISGSGKYPINSNFSGGNGNHVPQSMDSHANSMCPLSCMGFDRANPTKIVASSPFTGIFYKDGSHAWVDYSAWLLKPYSPISTVAIDDKDIYFGMEGRGLMRMYGY
jgi:hypothetical protein